MNPGIADLMARQLGTIARWQARELGMTDHAIEWRLTTGQWEISARGVYRSTSAPRSPRQEQMIACLWAGPDAVLSHATAGRLWDLDVPASAETHVMRRYTQSARNEQVIVHRTRRLDRIDRAIRQGLPVTSVERTLVDLAAAVSEEELEVALESALRQRLTFTERLSERVEALWGHPRLHVLRRLLRVRQSAPAESALEVEVERFLRQWGITGFIRQFEVWDGEQWRRLDWANPDVKVALEADSWKHHSGRRDWARDHTRNAALLALGWRTFSVTQESLASPARTAGQILSVCEQAAS